MPSNLCHLLLLLPSVFLSIRISGGQSIRAQLQHQSLQRTVMVDFLYVDWLDLLAVQRSLKSLIQHHNLKKSSLWCSADFMVQLSHPYMTTGKTIALTIRTFASKVMSLFFNTPSRFVIAFLPRSKHLLISWLQSQSRVILEPKKIVCQCFCFHLSPSISHEVTGPVATVFVFWMLSL